MTPPKAVTSELLRRTTAMTPVTLLLTALLAAAVAGSAQPSREQASPEEMRQALAAEVRKQLDPETDRLRAENEKLREELRATLASARDFHQATSESVSWQLDAMQIFLAIMTIILGIAGTVVAVFGYREGKRIRELRDEAEAAVEAAREQAESIAEMREGMIAAWDAIEKSELPEFPFYIVGAVGEIQGDLKHLFEDTDVVVVVSDRLRLPRDKKKSAKVYAKLDSYWRVSGNFPKAVARVRRAVQLAPESPEFHTRLAQSLAAWASSVGSEDARQQAKLLEEAEGAIATAVRLQGGEESAATLHHWGFIADERARAGIGETKGDFSEAIRLYRQAQAKTKSAALSREEERIQALVGYNLACALALSDRPEEAFQELEKLRGDEILEDLRKEKDFRSIHETPSLRGRFEELAKPVESRLS